MGPRRCVDALRPMMWGFHNLSGNTVLWMYSCRMCGKEKKPALEQEPGSQSSFSHPLFIYKPQFCNVCKTSCFQWFTFNNTKSWKYHSIWHSLNIKNRFIHLYLLIKSNWNGRGDINKSERIFTFEVSKKKIKKEIWTNPPTTFILHQSASDLNWSWSWSFSVWARHTWTGRRQQKKKKNH